MYTEIASPTGWTVVGFRKGHVLGPGTALELGLGALLGLTPIIRSRPR